MHILKFALSLIQSVSALIFYLQSKVSLLHFAFMRFTAIEFLGISVLCLRLHDMLLYRRGFRQDCAVYDDLGKSCE